MIKVTLPGSLEELWMILEKEPETGIYAGGTDLLVRRRKGLCRHNSLTCLERIEELKGIREEGERIFIGACTPFSQIISSRLIQGNFPLLIKAISVLGSPHIRNTGTIGGNIATASPAGDTLPPLYALDGEVILITRESSRCLPVREFIKGPGSTGIKSGEIISGLRLKKVCGFDIYHYEKVGQRQALSIAIVSLASMIEVDEKGIIKEARLAWGSVAPTIVRSAEAEEALIDKPLDIKSLSEAARIISKAVHPIDDVRATAEYRRIAAGNILLRLLKISPGS